MKVALVGATGLVGQIMRDVLEERNFPVTEFLPVASAKSVGQSILFKKKRYLIQSMEDAIKARPDLALFSAGGSVSKEFAPRFAEVGTTVIDNSSAWRMDADKKLIVPEVNAHQLTPQDKIIANPNCSTIQMVVPLHPLHQKYGIERLIISTYQSITGTGAKAVAQYQAEKKGATQDYEMAYPHRILDNCLPHCDIFLENGYTKEEMKLVHETQKILGDDNLKITATAVRVPVQGGHSESINITFRNNFTLKDIRYILENTDGVIIEDNISASQYPMPINAHGKDDIFVGRIRRDHSANAALNIWVVADNLRKGAATNAIQIAEYLLKKGYL